MINEPQDKDAMKTILSSDASQEQILENMIRRIIKEELQNVLLQFFPKSAPPFLDINRINDR
jgi:dephospho-CoA kinase